MSKKVKRRNHVEIRLEPDGFSVHTIELSLQLSQSEWIRCKQSLYNEHNQTGEHIIYPDSQCKGHHICTKYADAGIRIRLEKVAGSKDHPKHFVRMVINPRKLIYPQSSYLGILPPEEDSIELLEKTFRHLFRESPFEKDISRYYLSRVDLCTNIRCDNKRVFRELVRLLRKTATPKKYERKFYQHKNKKKANQYNKHYIRIACDSQELVIYDKTYQLDENDLVVAYDNLPSGVLRIEVHYGRDKLHRIERKEGTDDPLDLLWLLMQESKPRICKLVRKCYPEVEYRSYEACLDTIERSRFSEQTQSDMRTLVTQMQRKQTIDAALRWMKKCGMQTDGLLRKFDKLGVSPIPLRQGYAAERMPSLPEILQTIGEKPVRVALSWWKWK